MKQIVYIGNKAGKASKANLSSIDVLSKLLSAEGYSVTSASHKQNIVLRLLHMLYVCFKNRKSTDYVLIDTYSTLNFYYAFFVSALCRIFNLKYIPILHGGKLPNRLKTSPKLSKFIFNNAYVNVAPSSYLESQFKTFGFNNITNIPNAIEIDNYPFKERQFNEVKLLWVRSFSKIYNPLLAIKILKSLKLGGIDASLCMVGPDVDGNLDEARQFAKNENLNVTFTGKLTKLEWIALSNEYNIFINTTNFDNMPVSVIEAMALGLPVISTNVGGLPYLIKHEKTGILVKPNSVESFIFQINQLHSNSSYTSRLAINARRFVEDFNWDVVKKQWINLLK
ncbi:glycosyl transferase family 1 [Tamlana sedimentorum]|uniref:Glycosyl transferase family 1 n=1 Tax=Neotamlana sedimentorum TaxID=1435349 RepID=A0A0D7W9Y5_9FLAO|nr:glycosyltransferase family 4 protein [Tamlana sedimentorum]KJD35909.1 glycosyl transferase family 1 [Tamlana sedimentorum]